ncbi:MAG: MFS transporter [Xanthomonadales bacterium]|nr:MFS transporter [Xanthomonadales bacterium]
MNRTISNGTIAAYAAPLVPIWMLHTPALSILPGLYATVSGIDLAVIGAILVTSRILDGVTDPLIGLLSDATRTALGRRKPWIIAGGLLCMVGVWFWFRPSADTGALYFFLASIAVYIGWTMVEIPHGAWLSELSGDYEERSHIAGIRTTAIYLGYVVFWLGPFLPLFETTEITPEVTTFLSWVVIVLMLATMTWAVIKVPEGNPRNSETPNLTAAISGLVSNKPLRLFLVIIGASWLASGMVAGLYFFFISSYLEIPDKFGHIGLAVAAIGFVSASIWGWAGARLGKHRVLVICNLSTVITLVAMSLIRPGPHAFSAMLVIFSLSALFSAGSTVAYYALMADVVDYDTLMTRKNNAGNYYALITLFQKVGLGAGAGLALTVSALFGFDAVGENEGWALAGFFVAFIVIPIALNLLATILATLFPITRRRHGIIRRRLDSLALRKAEATRG